jgi:hypothetical protein
MVDIIATTTTTGTSSGWKSGAGTATYCPIKATVTLVGSTGTAWATDAIKKISASILTDSDGYKITLAVGRQNGTKLVSTNNEGGCLIHTNSGAVCFRGAISSTAILTGMKATWIKLADYKIGALVAGTEITAAKWGIVYDPICNVTTTPVTTACGATFIVADATVTYGGSWYQPKETAKKTYTTLPRFSVKETAKWTAITQAATKQAVSFACGSGKALTGASALVAGAAVAFGAAALAF